MKNTLDFFKRFGFAVLTLILIQILFVSATTGQDAEIKNSNRLLDIDKPTKAIEEINKAIAAYPTAAQLYYYLGRAQVKTNNDLDLATRSFEKGIALNVNEAMNYVGMGHVMLLKKKSVEAKANFEKALNLSKSKNVKVLQAIGEAYLSDPKFVKEAKSNLEKAKDLSANNPETFLLLGDALLLENNAGSAVSSYEWAAHYDKKNAKAHYKIGRVYLGTNPTMSEEAFLKAISADPEYTLAYKELGELYYAKKDGIQAVKYYETYLSLTEKPEKEQLRYAFFLFMSRDYSKANEVFKNLSQQANVTPVTLRYYAFSLFESGDYPQSKSIFEQYFAKVPVEQIEASDYAYHGKLLLKLSEDSLAMISMEKSILLEKNQPEVLQLMAESQLKNKHYPEAIQLYKQIMGSRKKPLSQDYFAIGRAYYYNEQFMEADSAFQKLAELQPNMTVGFLWQGRTQSSLDPETEKGLAKPAYEKLIEKALPTPDKNKNDLLEAYSYLGYYHFLKKEIPQAKSYWTKVLELNPNDERAKEALKELKKH